MPTFKPVVRTKRDFNPVYIRVTHRSKSAYIKTTLLAPANVIKHGQITDYNILGTCAIEIKKFIKKLNDLNISRWDVNDIRDFLISESTDISFSDFAHRYVERLRELNRDSSARTYLSAINSIERYYGRNILFSDLTARSITRWIRHLDETTGRAKRLYPVLLKKVFDEGCFEYNDYDNDIIRIKNQPFRGVVFPKQELPRKRYASVSLVRDILNIKPDNDIEAVAQDVARLTLCLAGINAIDLYTVEQHQYKNCKLCYNRCKEKNIRADKAYFEISIQPEIIQLLEKYKGNLRLFSFRERWCTTDNFNRAINRGLKRLCVRCGHQPITLYWLRHTWATVAQNVCGATDEQVAFALNHVSAHRVTRMYIEKDFTPVDTWNRRVIDAIFK